MEAKPVRVSTWISEVFLALRAVVVGWGYPRLAVVLLQECMGCCRSSLRYANPTLLIYSKMSDPGSATPVDPVSGKT